MRPAIIRVSQEHAAFLLDEFGRYARTELPDAHVLEAFHQWRTVVPTAP